MHDDGVWGVEMDGGIPGAFASCSMLVAILASFNGIFNIESASTGESRPCLTSYLSLMPVCVEVARRDSKV